MRRKHPSQSKEFKRDLKYFTNEDICDYAHHILQKFGNDINLDGELHESWYDTNGNEYTLTGSELNQEFPTYQLDVTDGQKINFVRSYTLSMSCDEVGLFDDEGESLPISDQPRLRNEFMNYIRTYRGINEPRINRDGRRAFGMVAAYFAVEPAMKEVGADRKLYSGPLHVTEREDFVDHVVDAALAQVIHIPAETTDDYTIPETVIPFTRSDTFTERAINEVIVSISSQSAVTNKPQP